jgi:Ca2+-binding RTX toxin-like protein
MDVDVAVFRMYPSIDALSVIFSGNDTISSSGVLLGFAGDDFLRGRGANDTLDGGTGIDVLLGGGGDDLYLVDEERDVIWEYAGEGSDKVVSSASYILPSNVERLKLDGVASINGTGNQSNNTIYGNNGANALSGADGDDTLAGEVGNDRLMGGMATTGWPVASAATILTVVPG